MAQIKRKNIFLTYSTRKVFVILVFAFWFLTIKNSVQNCNNLFVNLCTDYVFEILSFRHVFFMLPLNRLTPDRFSCRVKPKTLENWYSQLLHWDAWSSTAQGWEETKLASLLLVSLGKSLRGFSCFEWQILYLAKARIEPEYTPSTVAAYALMGNPPSC